MALFFYKRPELKYNTDFVNISWDFSVYEKGTKEKPVESIPEVKVVLLRDINRVTGSFSITDISTKRIFIEQSFNVCSWSKKSISGFFMRPVIELIEKAANFKMECPFKNRTILKIDKYDLESLKLTSFMEADKERVIKVVINQGRKAMPIFSVLFYYVKVDVKE